MRIIRAEVMGMCFGVRDALKALSAIEEPRDASIHGELVHNEVVLHQLAARGFTMAGEGDAARRPLPATSTVVVTAHGVSDRERERLRAAGKRIVDTTCPLVTRVHQAARTLQQEGYHILVIGRRGHVEVRGIVDDLLDYDVIESESDVRRYPFARLGVICQSTATERNVAQVRAAIDALNPDAEIRFIDTVCLPTKEHQRSLERLLDEVDAVVVVGGRNSNNTRELVKRCQERGARAWHVQGAADIDPGWFEGIEVVGLSAGTSTLDTTIDEVQRALEILGTAKHDPEIAAAMTPGRIILT